MLRLCAILFAKVILYAKLGENSLPSFITFQRQILLLHHTIHSNIFVIRCFYLGKNMANVNPELSVEGNVCSSSGDATVGNSFHHVCEQHNNMYHYQPPSFFILLISIPILVVCYHLLWKRISSLFWNSLTVSYKRSLKYDVPIFIFYINPFIHLVLHHPR